jgi:predicted nucleic acid-binding protein
MIVYCDTSFLLSYLYEDDVNHAAARARATRLVDNDFVVCEVHLLELPAAVRAATHRALMRFRSQSRDASSTGSTPQ